MCWKILLKKQNLGQISKFWPKIQIFVNNPNFGQKWEFCSKIENSLLTIMYTGWPLTIYYHISYFFNFQIYSSRCGSYTELEQFPLLIKIGDEFKEILESSIEKKQHILFLLLFISFFVSFPFPIFKLSHWTSSKKIKHKKTYLPFFHWAIFLCVSMIFQLFSQILKRS